MVFLGFTVRADCYETLKVSKIVADGEEYRAANHAKLFNVSILCVCFFLAFGHPDLVHPVHPLRFSRPSDTFIIYHGGIFCKCFVINRG